MGLVCELAFKKHFVNLAYQVGSQNVRPVPCAVPASTLQWKTSYKESHFLPLMKRFKTGLSVPGFLPGEGMQEFRRPSSEHVEPTHTPAPGSGVCPSLGH